MSFAEPVPSSGLRVRRALRWHERLQGLLATSRLELDEALEIAPCNSVHTAGMGYVIDVVFIDRRGRVVRIVESMQPWRAAICWRASRVVELAAGGAARHGLVLGSRWPPAKQRDVL